MIQMHKNNGKVMKKSFSKSVFSIFPPVMIPPKAFKSMGKKPQNTKIPFLVQQFETLLKSVLAALPAGKALRQVFMFRFHL